MPLLVRTFITRFLVVSYHFVRGLPTRRQFARFLLPSGFMDTFLMGSSRGERKMCAKSVICLRCKTCESGLMTLSSFNLARSLASFRTSWLETLDQYEC